MIEFRRQWTKWETINPLFLTFSRLNWEIPFLREPDPLFKFFIGCAALVLLSIGLIFSVPMILLSEWHFSTTLGFVLSMLFLMALLPLTWMHFVWNRCKDPHDEQEGHVPQPRNKLLHFMYQTSIKVVWSALLRTTLYLIITIMLALCAMFDLLVSLITFLYFHLNNNLCGFFS